ncbi:MAG: hypothetical protein II820_08390, partial [Ruminiclostridium sp.]|nr:hypothetical protein [Ruminiclostridium sp.]
HKGTHEKHLSVYEYEKKMRAQEVAELTEKADGLKKEIDDSERTVKSLNLRISGLESGERKLDDIEKELASSPEYNLPDPPALMTAKTYKTKFVEPIIKALKELVKTVLVKFFQVRNEYSRVLDNNGRLWREGENLRYEVDRLKEENKDLRHVNSELRKQNKDHALLRKIFGSEQIDQMILQAKQLDDQKKQKKRGWDAR